MAIRGSLSLCILAACFLTLPLCAESTLPVDETPAAASDSFLRSEAIMGAADELLYQLCLNLNGSDPASAVVLPDWTADLETSDETGSMLIDGVAFGDGDARLPFMISDRGRLLRGDGDAVAPFLDGDDTDGAEVEVIDPGDPASTSKTALFVLLATAVLMGLGNGRTQWVHRHKLLVRSDQ